VVTLALRSFVHHRSAALATALVSFVGMLLVTAMAALLGTGLAPTTTAADAPFLTQFPLIMGGWVVAIVLFAMVSTIGVTLAGRRGELAGLQLVGATPRQLQTMVAAETFVLSAVAAVPGTACGYLLGWLVMDRVHAAGLIDAVSEFAPGFALPLLGAVVVLVASVAAAWLGSRRLTAASPVGAPVATGRTSRGRGRRIGAAIALVAGLGSASSVVGLDADNVATTAMTGPACVLVAVGLAVLAPELLAVATRVVRVVTRTTGGAAGHLAAINMTAAPERVRPVVTFLTLFVGVAAGTLSMQGIENDYTAGGGSTDQVLASINYLVVVLIAVFMGIALTNNLVASIHQRRTEFAVMSLVGSTHTQTRGMLVGEVVAATVTSVVAGGLGAVVCVIPFAVVKLGDPLMALAPVPYLLAIVVGAALALGVTALVGTRTIRTA
jgi:putative ABC transport system permease protein